MTNQVSLREVDATLDYLDRVRQMEPGSAVLDEVVRQVEALQALRAEIVEADARASKSGESRPRRHKSRPVGDPTRLLTA
jgi:hypothetical protein